MTLEERLTRLTDDQKQAMLGLLEERLRHSPGTRRKDDAEVQDLVTFCSDGIDTLQGRSNRLYIEQVVDGIGYIGAYGTSALARRFFEVFAHREEIERTSKKTTGSLKEYLDRDPLSGPLDMLMHYLKVRHSHAQSIVARESSMIPTAEAVFERLDPILGIIDRYRSFPRLVTVMLRQLHERVSYLPDFFEFYEEPVANLLEAYRDDPDRIPEIVDLVWNIYFYEHGIYSPHLEALDLFLVLGKDPTKQHYVRALIGEPIQAMKRWEKTGIPGKECLTTHLFEAICRIEKGETVEERKKRFAEVIGDYDLMYYNIYDSLDLLSFMRDGATDAEADYLLSFYEEDNNPNKEDKTDDAHQAFRRLVIIRNFNHKKGNALTPAECVAYAQIAIPGYTVVQKLGSGGSGDVYLAIKENSDVPRKLKVFRERDLDPRIKAQRQRRGITDIVKTESDVLAEISHPNVARYFDHGTCTFRDQRDVSYTVSEYVEGMTVEEALPTLSFTERAVIFYQLAEVMAFFHGLGYVIRDFKLNNAIWNPQKKIVKVTDLETIRRIDDEREEGNSTRGSDRYAAPEIMRGERATTKSDLYALGACFLYLHQERVGGLEELNTFPEDEYKRRLGEVISGLPSLPSFSNFGGDVDIAFDAYGERKQLEELFGDAKNKASSALHLSLSRQFVLYSLLKHRSEDRFIFWLERSGIKGWRDTPRILKERYHFEPVDLSEDPETFDPYEH